MADPELIAPAPPPAPAAPAAPAPAAPAAPVVVEAAPAVEAPAPVLADPAPTIIGEALAEPVAPVVPVEPAPAPEPVKVEGQSEEPAPPPTYEAFTLPEGVTVDPVRIGEFTGLLGEFEGQTKADHAAVQAFGQRLLERHVAEVLKAVADAQRLQDTQRSTERLGWKDEFLKDPELGGNRFQTTVDSALNFIRTHGGTAEEQAEFRALMETSGVGNHKAMIRMLARAGSAMREGGPLAAQQPAPLKMSKTEALYGRRAG